MQTRAGRNIDKRFNSYTSTRINHLKTGFSAIRKFPLDSAHLSPVFLCLKREYAGQTQPVKQRVNANPLIQKYAWRVVCIGLAEQLIIMTGFHRWVKERKTDII